VSDGSTIAIIVSFLSLGVSAFALGWNIYRDVYLKARLRLSFRLMTVHHPTFPQPIWRYILSTTNLGPGKVKLQTLALRNYSLWKRITRKVQHAVVIHDFKNPLGGQLPCDVDVGHGMDFSFPPDKCTWLGEDYTQIGIADSFGRMHWCNKEDITEAKKKFHEKAWTKDPFKGTAEAAQRTEP
jgi:hypothetical protein